MGRNVKVRASYYHDTQFLLRLKQAVEDDHARPVEWRSSAIGKLQEVIEVFINAPSQTSERKSDKDIAS